MLEYRFDTLIENCNEVLSNNWEKYVNRFNEYVKNVNENYVLYKRMKPIRMPKSIIPCVPIRDASSPTIKFNLRYKDKKIAEIVGLDKNKFPRLRFRKQEILKGFGLINKYDASTIYDWNSHEAKRFRSHFKNLAGAEINEDIDFNQEATIQTALWKKLKDDKKSVGSLRNIQPVCMYNRFFEPPAFISASNIYDDQVQDSPNSGNIDMIARIGRGNNSELAIIEMKKANQTSPIQAVRQALIYAVCIKKLLFCKELGNHAYKWWNLFGYNKEYSVEYLPPTKFIMHAVACMPYRDGIEKAFTQSFELGDGVTLKLDYMYFDFNPGDIKSIKFRKENISINNIEVV